MHHTDHKNQIELDYTDDTVSELNLPTVSAVNVGSSLVDAQILLA